jgi:ribonuclease HII
MIIPDITLEQSLWAQGFINVAGIDEAGKGPWAGPVSAGAVVIHEEKQIVKSVRDSKLMSAKQREKAFDEICTKSSAFGMALVSAEEIDAIGIDHAVKKAMYLALSEIEKNFKITIDYVIVDGSKTKPLEKYRAKRIKAGGLYHYSIAAGSILAKVTRDRLMKDLAKKYPEYGFDQHVGYGTKIHQQALAKYGICPLHRKCFAPIKKLITP